jgi:hypothetical protein
MLIVWYSAFSDRIVVIDPAPAINGNAIGNIDPPAGESILKSSIPRIISIAIRKIINEPAIAKEETSIPKTPSNGLPIRRNAISMIKTTIEVLIGTIFPDLDFMSRITGMEPGISIMAKSTINDAKISIKLKCISDKFIAKVATKK